MNITNIRLYAFQTALANSQNHLRALTPLERKCLSIALKGELTKSDRKYLSKHQSSMASLESQLKELSSSGLIRAPSSPKTHHLSARISRAIKNALGLRISNQSLADSLDQYSLEIFNKQLANVQALKAEWNTELEQILKKTSRLSEIKKDLDMQIQHAKSVNNLKHKNAFDSSRLFKLLNIKKQNPLYSEVEKRYIEECQKASSFAEVRELTLAFKAYHFQNQAHKLLLNQHVKSYEDGFSEFNRQYKSAKTSEKKILQKQAAYLLASLYTETPFLLNRYNRYYQACAK